MLASKYRYHSRNAVRSVYKRGKTERSQYISLTHCPSRRNEFRMAVVVSKKVTKNAPKRNKMRRRIYEIVRKNVSNTNTGYDLLFTVYDARVADMPNDELEKTILKLLKNTPIL